MNQSTGTSGSDTRPSVQGPGSPALAYVNPQPRLPHSEAAPPEQPETFMRRARRVQLGSHRLKLWYLALCTYGRARTRGEEVLEIGIKQRTLAGELETGINVVSRTLAELRETGLVLVLRKKYHSTIRIFLTPQGQPDTPQVGVSQKGAPGSDTPLLGVSGGVVDGRDTPQVGVSRSVQSGPDTPQVGVADTPQVGVTNVSRSCTDVQQQQQQHPVRRPQFSWTRIKGESDVKGGGGHGSVEEGAGSGVGADGGSPEGERSRRRRRGGWGGGLGARPAVEREPETGRGVAAAARRVAGDGLA